MLGKVSEVRPTRLSGTQAARPSWQGRTPLTAGGLLLLAQPQGFRGPNTQRLSELPPAQEPQTGPGRWEIGCQPCHRWVGRGGFSHQEASEHDSPSGWVTLHVLPEKAEVGQRTLCDPKCSAGCEGSEPAGKAEVPQLTVLHGVPMARVLETVLLLRTEV